MKEETVQGPCMGTLSLTILAKNWMASQGKDEIAVARRKVGEELHAVVSRKENCGCYFLKSVHVRANREAGSSVGPEKLLWEYVRDLVQVRLETEEPAPAIAG